MSMTPVHMCTVRLPAALVEATQRLADARGLTFSDVVRSALLSVVELDPGVRQHATVVYEIAKTRSVLLRLLDTQLDTSQVNQLLALAEGDATKYVRERLGEDNGTT
jgi:hypothetical protein